MKQLLIIGCGYAGLWAAISAAKIKENYNSKSLNITVVNKTPFHANRVCNYQDNLDDNLFDATDILQSVDVNFLVADIEKIDAEKETVYTKKGNVLKEVPYDVLILAVGSEVYCPDIPGLKEFSFNIGNYESAKKLYQHLDVMVSNNICIIGAGFCGIELACELAISRPNYHIYLIDQHEVGAALGDNPKQYIREVLASNQITMLSNKHIQRITQKGIDFVDGHCIESDVVIWAGGLRANSLHQCLRVEKDSSNRLEVNTSLQLPQYPNVFVAGDMAAVSVDGVHKAFMSCQHARPQGAIAGYNAVMYLLNKPMRHYSQPNYVTCLDLGGEQALFTKGWDRQVAVTGYEAKLLKNSINQQRITPPSIVNKENLYKVIDDLL